MQGRFCLERKMIRREDVLPWFEKLDKQIEGIPIEKFGYEQITAHGCKSFQAWMAEAATVIGEVFPPVHPIRRMWTHLGSAGLSRSV
jgi:hypothetical protein